MVRKKIDNRIRTLIENGIKLGHRTLFAIVGDKGRDQVVILHHMLAKAEVRSRPSVLWCYKKELGFSSHRKKRMKHLQHRLQAGKLSVNEDDPFELFLSSTKIRYCYYSETHKILGNTYGMCVLQDFEALTPNLLARTIETVEGGGLVVILLRSVNSLRQLYTMSMDVHQRFRTEAHQNITCRFNERFLLSLASNRRCLVVDDQLSVLPISSHNLHVTPIDATVKISAFQLELDDLKAQLRDTQPIGQLIGQTRTLDQAKALLKFVEAISEKSLTSTVSLTAARGRGKSSALGLAVAAAIAFGYSNVFVTSPSPENLCTLFEFIFKGFDALEYQEHIDYSLVQSTNPDFNRAIVRVNVFREHRQTIQYIQPCDAAKLAQAELLVIDEAAAIPLPFVRALLGPYLVFLASTINGYEGTGRSLSLKLLQQLRVGSTSTNGGADKKGGKLAIGRCLHEISLEESIRYKDGDEVEDWLTKLLCLDATNVAPILSGCPTPDNCELYYINRDTLFCYHKASEEFLQRLVALYVSSHYKNTPNDLQMMSDAPAHHLFCLLGPVTPNRKTLPEVLAIVQVCLEGEISKTSALDGFARGKRAAGDLIPWTIGQQYQDADFPRLSGARIVRIATHPDYQSMGYGAKALQLLRQYYELKIPNLDDDGGGSEPAERAEIERVDAEEVNLLVETIEPRKALPPLLTKLNERTPERLDYLGVSFGLTEQLLRFWKRAGFIPVYLRQTTNDLTGEHSCIMIQVLNDDSEEKSWLQAYWGDFRRRFVNLLGYQFAKFTPALGLSVLTNKSSKIVKSVLTKSELEAHVTNYDLKRLEMYSNNLVDYHLIIDLMPILARLYFLNKMSDTSISAVQSAILLGVGLQYKTVDTLAIELDLPATQLLGLFNRMIRKFVHYLNAILEEEVEKSLAPVKDVVLAPVAQSMQAELEEAANALGKKQRRELQKLKNDNLAQFAIKGSEEEWEKNLVGKSRKSIISVKSGEKRMHENREKIDVETIGKKSKKKKFKK